MIAGEEKFIAIEQRHAAPRMAWHWDDQQIVVQPQRPLAVDDALDVGSSAAHVVSVKDALATKPLRVGAMLGDVVAVAQKHPAHPTLLLQTLHQRSGGPRRIDEDVSLLTTDEIARRSERRF